MTDSEAQTSRWWRREAHSCDISPRGWRPASVSADCRWTLPQRGAWLAGSACPLWTNGATVTTRARHSYQTHVLVSDLGSLLQKVSLNLPLSGPKQTNIRKIIYIIRVSEVTVTTLDILDFENLLNDLNNIKSCENTTPIVKELTKKWPHSKKGYFYTASTQIIL